MPPHINYDRYEKLWKKVDSLEAQNLTKSALEKVLEIYDLANKSENAPQTVKSLIYTVKYKQVLEEGGFEKVLESFETAISKSDFPAKNILQSAAAELYWSYYEENRWRFSERTQMADPESKDIETWDLHRITQHATTLYRASLENTDSLQQMAIEPFAAILQEGNMSVVYRPTLYDFLAHRAIDFFMNEEAYVTQPAYKFTLEGTEVFQPSAQFIRLNITSKDSLSGKLLAFQTLQKLISFHLRDSSPDALVDAELKRFSFLHTNSVNELKDSLYADGLKQLEQRFLNDSASAYVSYQLAAFYAANGNKYDPVTTPGFRNDKVIALSYCDKVLTRFPASNAAKSCKALRIEITRKAFSLTIEQVNQPGHPFRGLMEYKNVNKIFYRIIKYTPELAASEDRANPEEGMKRYLQEPAVLSWSQTFPDAGDYQMHASEIKIPALPLGRYLILSSAAENFSMTESGITKAATYISNLSYLSKRNKDRYSFYVLNRESGKPISKAGAKLLIREYESQNRTYLWKEIGNYVTNQQGYLEIPALTDQHNFQVEFSSGEDKLRCDDYFYLYKEREENQKTLRTIFYTDRAIYRPGQTIYFKGIVLEETGDEHTLKTGFNSVVVFNDVNGQKVHQLSLTTNDFGSFQGSFTAPGNGLNGEMSLTNGSGTTSFSVEEYKRPKFEVVFDSLKGSWRLNEMVTVTGSAKSYAGANIDGATVNYRVVRRARLPIWYYYGKRSGYDRFAPEMEIANGTSITDANGAFTVSFKAIPDLKIPAKDKPQFDYSIIADVADISGETHSSETVVAVGYVSVNVDLSIPEEVSADSLADIMITSVNLNRVFEPASGTIVIHALEQPDRIFRKRLWKKPDQFVMTQEEFYKAFPYDLYDQEDDFTKWNVKSSYAAIAFNTGNTNKIALPALPQGKYHLELKSKDTYGEDFVMHKYFTVYAPKDKQLPLLQTFWFPALNEKATTGTNINFQAGTSEKDLTVIYQVSGKNINDLKLMDWKKGKETFEIPVTENMAGGIYVSAFAVKHGRIYSFNQTIAVPYTSKELKISFESFRDKLLPGQNEEWKLKISGAKGEAVAAEMVATLYDASLDAFRTHNWEFDIYQRYYPYARWEPGNCFSNVGSEFFDVDGSGTAAYFMPTYNQLNWFGLEMRQRYLMRSEAAMDGSINAEMRFSKPTLAKDEEVQLYDKSIVASAAETKEKNDSGSATVAVRKNLQETAFFFPQLRTDSAGNVIISFTIPEALTRWKLLGFAHTADLRYAQTSKELVTQKELMAIPNAPRFFREGDKIQFAGKVTNLSGNALSGTATLQLFDALTMRPVDTDFGNTSNVLAFTVEKGQSTALSWALTVPEGFEAIAYRLIAKAGNQSDGEENVLPVISNKMLVTESLPINIRGNAEKNYSFTKLLQSGASSTLKNYQLTLEFTGNPAWYAVQALPYLMEYPYQCSEQTFNRFYANALASHIANSNPKIKQVFDQWRNLNPDALLSNLEKNQELKSLLLQETPWVLQSQNETERKKRIALLFDLNRMSSEMTAALQQLEQLQTPNGGWAWFAGGPDNRYITQYILAGIGHLQQLNITGADSKTRMMVERAIPYLDARIQEDYDNLIKYKVKTDQNNLSYHAAYYFYARSYFNDIPVSEKNKKAFDYYKSQVQQYWTKQGIYAQGMIALALFRSGDKKTAVSILKSLKENAIVHEELGMYWKSNNSGYYWYEAPVETQALLIEAFDDAGNDVASVDAMKLWLLKQKQTNEWKSTKATAEAVYALLLRGSIWLMNEPAITVSLGKQVVDLSKTNAEPGTGYYKTSWKENEITPQMGSIKVVRKSSEDGVSWGAVYWQYFEQLDKITTSATPLSLKKKLYLQRNSAAGPVLELITASTILHPGDLVKVVVELRTDRDMEYVHMKDMRAACFEPLNVLSGYQWQDGLGYYQETRDAATNFFFDYLRKGTYVFEYPLRVQLKGDFSNGITTVQCMYAPEFTSHSEGVRVIVK